MSVQNNNDIITMGELRDRVKERVAQEAAQIPPSEGQPKIDSNLIQECLFANALGDGILYSTLFRDRFVYCQNTQEWYAWAGHYWERDLMSRSLAAVEEVVEHYLAEHKRLAAEISELLTAGEESTGKITKLKLLKDNLLKRVFQLRDERRRTTCLKFARTIDNPLAIKGEEFDCKPLLFPCKNGVLDLETGRINPGRPGDYLSLASPVPFIDIDTPAPLWEKSLLEIFNGNEDLVAYLQRLFGYAMTGLVTEKVFPVLYGPTGWNGRTLIIETIRRVMGDLAGAISSDMLLSTKYPQSSSGPSSDIISLRGIRLAFASEINEGRRFCASKIKWLSGKDELVGRSPYDKYPTRFSPTHKLFLMTNILPKAPPHDKAFWERLHLIPFMISFVNRNPQGAHERRANLDLDRQLIKEASGILAWLLRGCLLWQRDGLNPPRDVIEATEQYHRGEDLLADYIDECCITTEPSSREKGAALYARFVIWYRNNIGQNEPSGTFFGRELSQKFDKVKSSGCIWYCGIAIK